MPLWKLHSNKFKLFIGDCNEMCKSLDYMTAFYELTKAKLTTTVVLFAKSQKQPKSVVEGKLATIILTTWL
jgi:hypothetical protein